jgi:hypothetical protein
VLTSEVQADGSELLLIVPLAGAPEGVDEAGAFDDADADLELPPEFFATLRRRPVRGGCVIEFGERTIDVRRVSAVAVGDGDLESWFVVAAIDPGSNEASDWLDCARLLSKVTAVRSVCPALGVEAFDSETRGTVLVSMLVDDPSAVPVVADHLRTRAPASESVVKLDESDSAHPASGDGPVTRRVMTRRTCGFVIAGAASTSYFTRKLPRELNDQYMLAVAMLHWQRRHLLQILEGAQQIWAQTDGGAKGVERSSSIRRRFESLTELRGRYARLAASGTFGPVFESTNQARFWQELKDVYGVIDRYQEVSDTLDTLGQSIETEAGLRLERLLAFFALVLGVPSLIFGVFGGNIGGLTTSNTVSWLLVTFIFAVCLVIGGAAYISAVGVGADRRRRRRRRGLR